MKLSQLQNGIHLFLQRSETVHFTARLFKGVRTQCARFQMAASPSSKGTRTIRNLFKMYFEGHILYLTSYPETPGEC